jgi:hypothetical protein
MKGLRRSGVEIGMPELFHSLELGQLLLGG